MPKKKMPTILWFFLLFYTVATSIELLRMLHKGDWKSAQVELAFWFATPISSLFESILYFKNHSDWGEFGVWLERFIIVLSCIIKWVCREIPLWSYMLLGWCWKVVLFNFYIILKKIYHDIKNETWSHWPGGGDY